MSMLLLQTFLLMLTAFFLGAFVACLMKSTFFDVAAERTAEVVPVPAPMPQLRPAAVVPQPPPRPAPEAVRPRIETVARPASVPAMPLPDAQRFERALREQTPASAPPVAPSVPVVPAPAPTVVAPPATTVVVPTAAAAATTPIVVPKPASVPTPAAPRIEVKPPAPLELNPLDPKPSRPTPQPAATPPPVGPVGAKLEPGSTSGAAAAVAAAAAMAMARAAQAGLKTAGPTSPSPASPSPNNPVVAPPPPAASESAQRPIMPVAAGSSGPATVSAPIKATSTPVAAPADDLTRIRAIDAATQSRLNALGVSRYDEVARWTTADVTRLRAVAGIGSRIAVENWIEQAQILAKGGTTEYARRRAVQGQTLTTAGPSPNAGVTAPLRTQQPPPPAPIAPKPLPAATPPAPPIAPAVAVSAPVSAPAAFELPRSGAQAAAAAAAAIAAAAAAAARRTEAVAGTSTGSPAAQPAPVRDDLQRIHGISADTEKLLYAQGVNRFSQIANWTAADIDRLGGLLGAPGRIARENWIEQAAVLAIGSGGAYTRRADAPQRAHDSDAPRPARLADALRERDASAKPAEPARAAPAPPARTDLSNLRSVRSEALRGDGQSAGAAVDDLKRIRGIGVLIEKKLNSLGTANYEQIANWTGADIDRISQILDFKGRIEREGWVEQARILASGGKTEFSQRVDKGDA